MTKGLAPVHWSQPLAYAGEILRSRASPGVPDSPARRSLRKSTFRRIIHPRGRAFAVSAGVGVRGAAVAGVVRALVLSAAGRAGVGVEGRARVLSAAGRAGAGVAAGRARVVSAAGRAGVGVAGRARVLSAAGRAGVGVAAGRARVLSAAGRAGAGAAGRARAVSAAGRGAGRVLSGRGAAALSRRVLSVETPRTVGCAVGRPGVGVIAGWAAPSRVLRKATGVPGARRLLRNVASQLVSRTHPADCA